MQARLLSLTLTLAVTTALVGACGSDSKKSGTPDGTGGSGAGGGGSAPEADAGVGCGSKICTAPAGVEACCQDSFAGTCGFKNSAGLCGSTPPVAASNCPGLNAGAQGTLAGCCTAGKMCGIDTTPFNGPGCIDNATFRQAAMSMGFASDAGLANFPAAQACPP